MSTPTLLDPSVGSLVAQVTELWEVRPDGKRYLLNEIGATSKFRSVEVPKSVSELQHTAEAQAWIAKQLKDGWTLNGPYAGIYKYEIFQHRSVAGQRFGSETVQLHL